MATFNDSINNPFLLQKTPFFAPSKNPGFNTKMPLNAHYYYSAKKSKKLYLFIGRADKKPK